MVIRTRIAEQGSRGIRFGYEMLCNGELRAEGSSAHIWVSRETRRPVRADAQVTEAFARWATAASSGS